jgi:hypothetical protein
VVRLPDNISVHHCQWWGVLAIFRFTTVSGEAFWQYFASPLLVVRLFKNILLHHCQW